MDLSGNSYFARTRAVWNFSHGESARNSAITTITGAGSDILYVYTQLNNTAGLVNNSPIFSNRPVPFACVGQRFCRTPVPMILMVIRFRIR